MTRRHTRPGRDAQRVRRGPGLTEADLAADWLDPVRPLVRRRGRPPGCPSRTRWWSRTADAAGRPSARTVLLKGYDERGLRLLHQLRRRARAPSWPPTRTPAWSSRGSRCSGRWSSPGGSSGSTGPRPRRTSPPGRAAPSSAPGPARSRRWCRTGRRWTRRYRAAAERFADGEPVPAPPHWGGLRVRPGDGRVLAGPAGRLHDRLRFRRVDRRAAGSSSGWRRDGELRDDPAARQRAAGRSTLRPLRHAGVPAAVLGNARVVLRLPVHRGRRAGADVRADPLVALGRPARASPASYRCWSSGSGAARSPTRVDRRAAAAGQLDR